ncbi:glycosyltransferase [Haloactinopolyspora alba]|nr:glycosyltransferase [Haloactinopolyspora alba]
MTDDDQPSQHRTKRERVLDRHVSSLSRALWMGFTDDALAELESFRRSIENTPRLPVARAAEALARWYATEKKYDLALDRLVFTRMLNGSLHTDRLRVLEHHILTQLGHFEEAELLFQTWGAQSPDLHLAQANLRLRQAEAGVVPREQADRDRLELIDEVFHRHAVTPISRLVDSSRALEFASLKTDIAPVGESEAENPTISIVVPAYNAESTLVTSVNSLRAQTLRKIEILVVDDASTDNTSSVAKSLASDDPRVKVLRHDQNQGAYGARNTGLTNASGTYFTVHDADDWSHPQLLERQLQMLRSHNATGSFSRLARVSPQMEFQLRTYRPMLEPIHWNYTSLLTTTQTMRDLGGWDTVRAHADSEFIERLREHFGEDSLVETDTEVPLSFFLVAGNNLTERKDTGMRSIDFGARREYTEQARFWRQQTFGEGEIPSYSEHRRSDAKSPFFSPRSLAGNRDQISQSYDLIIGSDLSLLGGTRRCNLAYIDCARKLGLRIGVFNMPRYRSRGSGTIDPSYRELFQADDVDLILPEDHVSAEALLVHHPPVLRYAFAGYPNITASKHYLLVNQLPWQMKDHGAFQYETSSVIRRYADAFGDEPTWISISPRVRRHLGDVLPPEAILSEDWYPIVDWADMSPPIRTRGPASAPVVGRHSRDHATKWPEDASTLAKSYLADTGYDVRLVGGAKAAHEVLGYWPKNWTVYPFDSVAVSDFVQEIDIFVHFHHSKYIEEFGRNIAEAMAMGVPCVLPTEYAEIFGDAAVYAEADDVAETIRELWADADRYHEYSRRGAEFVTEYCGSEVGMRRVASLLK